MKIKYLKHKEIDKDRWNICVESASNTIIYAFSWYLDIVSPNWEALVFGNYEYVMPLPAKRKYCIWYLFQPRYTQQLGVFGNKPNSEMIELFVKNIPRKFLVVDLNLNIENQKAELLPNYELLLNKPYVQIKSSYSKNLKRNLSKSAKADLVIKENIDLKIILDFLQRNSRFKLEQSHFTILEKLIIKSKELGNGTVQSCFKHDKLVSFAFFLETEKRIIFLVGAVSDEGRKVGAMPFLIDNYIKINSESPKVFDFEGSKDGGVARFYGSFGAEMKNYYRLKKKF